VVFSELLSELPAVEPGLVKLSKGEDSLIVSVTALKSIREAVLTIGTIFNRERLGTYSTYVLRWKHRGDRHEGQYIFLLNFLT